MFQRVAAVIAILLTALAARGYPAASTPQSALVIAGLGQGQVRLNGFWRQLTTLTKSIGTAS